MFVTGTLPICGSRLRKKSPGQIELVPGSWTEKFSSDFRGAVLCV
jgi:hypothetical protein